MVRLGRRRDAKVEYGNDGHGDLGRRIVQDLVQVMLFSQLFRSMGIFQVGS